jgi:hypothetical protein
MLQSGALLTQGLGASFLMRDLESKRLIVVKGVLFLLIAVASAGLVVLDNPSFRTALLLVMLVWSVCRFYYFMFYVLEKYVDPSLRYSGVGQMIYRLLRRK